MYIERALVLHMVDDTTYLSAAQFVDQLTIESFCETILTLWTTVYTGLPNTLVFDDGSQFRDTVVEICEIHDVEWQRSRTQHYNALGIGERYRGPIRHTFRKHRIDHPKLTKEFLLSLAVKACNDILEPEGILLSVLLFGEFPHYAHFSDPKYQQIH